MIQHFDDNYCMDQHGRPDWDSYFMALAVVASQRSLDPATKHGCIVTTANHNILSIGYNGPPRGADDSKIPLTRPEKYAFMAHAEANAIDNCLTSVEGAVVYVTGMPCSACMLRLVQRGVSKIVYGHVGSFCVDPNDSVKSYAILDAMLPERRPLLVSYTSDDFSIVMLDALEYIAKKCEKRGAWKVRYIKRLWKKIWRN
jgi:dCMP deaminase